MRFRQILIAAATLFLVGLVVVVVLGRDDESAGNPASELTVEQATQPLSSAPPELAALREEANELLPGGLDEFEARLAELQDHPVVANLWASWCVPCRNEFPHLQRVAIDRGDEIAFLGVDTEDGDDAARTFLDQLPLPYPSISDSAGDVKDEVRAVGLPATAFYDSSGELAYLKQGPYTSEDDLIADIERYAN
jgi:cytochrome c biogenesis protein CcmG/thiol:disulfide interchange protein DsbE